MKELQLALQMHQSGKRAHEYFPVRLHSPSQAKKVLPFEKTPQNNVVNTLSRTMNAASNNKSAVIYIHVPFCHKICDFCGYTRITTNTQSIHESYLNTVINHIEQASHYKWAQKKSIAAIYFGGGTPSVLNPEFIGDTLRTIKESYTLLPDCEITVESTITDLSENHMKLFNTYGVNRLSLGVQSFDTGVRKGIGRLADKSEILQFFEHLPNYNFNNICIDLIYNLENQTTKTWIDGLNQIKGLPISGCSVYPLILHPASILFKEKKGVPQNKELEMQYFKIADEILQNLSDWEIITPVQYGHALNGTARYIQLQGQNVEILSFGPGAMGKVNGTQYLNPLNVYEFIKQKDYINNNVLVFQIKELFNQFNAIYLLSENLFIPTSQYETIKPYFKDILTILQQIECIEKTHEGYKLTQEGRFWAANLSHVFSKRISELLSED